MTDFSRHLKILTAAMDYSPEAFEALAEHVLRQVAKEQWTLLENPFETPQHTRFTDTDSDSDSDSDDGGETELEEEVSPQGDGVETEVEEHAFPQQQEAEGLEGMVLIAAGIAAGPSPDNKRCSFTDYNGMKVRSQNWEITEEIMWDDARKEQNSLAKVGDYFAFCSLNWRDEVTFHKITAVLGVENRPEWWCNNEVHGNRKVLKLSKPLATITASKWRDELGGLYVVRGNKTVLPDVTKDGELRWTKLFSYIATLKE